MLGTHLAGSLYDCSGRDKGVRKAQRARLCARVRRLPQGLAEASDIYRGVDALLPVGRVQEADDWLER